MDGDTVASEIRAAAEKGDCEKLRKFLRYRGPMPPTLHQSGITEGTKIRAAFGAATMGRLECLRILYEDGVDLTKRDGFGRTMLSLAATRGHHNIIEQLIQYGCKVNEIDANGTSPLIQASGTGHLAAVLVLLNHKPNVNFTNKKIGGVSALSTATKNGHLKIMKALLSNGGDANIYDKNRDTPLILAAENRNFDCVKLLLSHNACVNATNANNETAICKAAQHCETEIVRLLIQHSARVNACDNGRYRPLMYAAMCKMPGQSQGPGKQEVAQNEAVIRAKCLELLLAEAASINATNQHGDTALSLASRYGHPEYVKLLLSHGAEVQISTPVNNPILVQAAMGGELDSVRLLLCAGARIYLPSYHHQRNPNPNLCVLPLYLMTLHDYHPNFGPQQSMVRLLYAAGCEPAPWRPECLVDWLPNSILLSALKDLCRRVIRSKVMQCNPELDLFKTLPKTGLPPALVSYLLYFQTLETSLKS